MAEERIIAERKPTIAERKPTIEAFAAAVAPTTVAVCCGCICVDKCFWNSPARMRDLYTLLRDEKVELPVEVAKLIQAESAEVKE